MRLASLLVLAALLAGCTAAPTPPERPDRLESWPAWDVGDSWTWHVRSRGSDGRFVEGEVRGTVLSVDAETYLVHTVDNRGAASNQTFWRSNMSLTTSPSEPFRLPLEAGANWTAAGQRYRVAGLERISTPAGAFWAWRINGTEDVAAPDVWRDDWWAPEAKVWVKSRQAALVQGGHIAIERELQEYRLASGASS